ncbi:MAG: VOC family protein [Bacteroidota bacterium]|nr:VOC family protein [Bacteroidota bacterium]MDP4228306.1 VOC family protein [Bacteroidota bacterium]
MNTSPKYICPLLVVTDMQKSRQFYETILGQKVILDYGENITFQGNFALHLQSHYQSLISNKEIKTGGNDFELYFEYDDVEKMTGQLKEAGITFVHEMREQPWRQRVVRFYDPDRHIIEIGESLEHLSFRLYQEGMTVNEITKIILMPEEFVKAGIEQFK